MSKIIEFFVGSRESGEGYEFRARGAVVMQVVRLIQRPVQRAERADAGVSLIVAREEPQRYEWISCGDAVPPESALRFAETHHALDLHVWEARDGVTATVGRDQTNVWWVADVRYIRTGGIARRPASCGGTYPTADLARRDAEDWAAAAARGAAVRWV